MEGGPCSEPPQGFAGQGCANRTGRPLCQLHARGGDGGQGESLFGTATYNTGVHFELLLIVGEAIGLFISVLLFLSIMYIPDSYVPFLLCFLALCVLHFRPVMAVLLLKKIQLCIFNAEKVQFCYFRARKNTCILLYAFVVFADYACYTLLKKSNSATLTPKKTISPIILLLSSLKRSLYVRNTLSA